MTTKQVQEFKETGIGKIPVDWKLQKISDLYEIRSGLSKPREEFGFGYPFLSFKEIFENFSLPDKLKNLVNSSEKERELGSIKKGDVFLTRTSETWDQLGMSSVALKDYKNATFNGFAKRLRPIDNKTILPEFAMFLFRSPKIQNQFSMHSNLTTRASLSGEAMKHVLLTIPTIEEQEKISKYLYDLIIMIQNLQNQNKILEKIVKSIFRSWFIDFDGVTEWDNSEVGKIPKGWSIGNMGKLINFIKGKKPAETSVRFKENFLPHILIENLNGKIPLFCSPEKMVIVNETESIMVMDGASSGRIEIGYQGVIGSTLAKIIPQKILGNIYTYHFLKTHEKDINKNTTGTSIPHVDKGKIKNLNVVIPDKNTMNTFERIALTIIQKRIHNKTEINTLIIILNKILPKLMSGEIRV